MCITEGTAIRAMIANSAPSRTHAIKREDYDESQAEKRDPTAPAPANKPDDASSRALSIRPKQQVLGQKRKALADSHALHSTDHNSSDLCDDYGGYQQRKKLKRDALRTLPGEAPKNDSATKKLELFKQILDLGEELGKEARDDIEELFGAILDLGNGGKRKAKAKAFLSSPLLWNGKLDRKWVKQLTEHVKLAVSLRDQWLESN